MPKFIRFIASLMFALSSLFTATAVSAQTAPTAYSITQVNGAMGSPITSTVYRDGNKALIAIEFGGQSGSSAHRTATLYDLKQGTTFSWDPVAQPIVCSAGSFSGDWGDPFAMTGELSTEIANGHLKATGTETLNGLVVKLYTGGTPQAQMKVWLDEKHGLVIRAMMGAPGAAMQTMIDITKASFVSPAASVFTLPAECASVHRAPTEAETIATETGDSASNYVNAIYGPGSKEACSVVLRVMKAGSMTPITSRLQVAIDTTYNMDSPTAPHYEFGMRTDGSQSFSGGGIREITNQLHDGMVRIDNPPAYFNLGVNLMKPGTGTGMGLIYRQCFAPTTVLLYVVKDADDPSKGGDWLWVKSGKYAAVPSH